MGFMDEDYGFYGRGLWVFMDGDYGFYGWGIWFLWLSGIVGLKFRLLLPFSGHTSSYPFSSGHPADSSTPAGMVYSVFIGSLHGGHFCLDCEISFCRGNFSFLFRDRIFIFAVGNSVQRGEIVY
jgi:hypothetical protein